ncbi:sarcoplasmic calcium-binding protein-like [Lingula anatina]|uniref:Sarcoplasmic calcium-binding protein-like n=1 Tax=Lingula anatina TaxID=7574 RepID=A0A1S3IKZ5_LINAN|nr:sarcoplasmic calcium-binding protein-like [Lingula anatina]|eukprot:XP_013398758.1 sarcoplasmic calcium-binding protein-like [Lingula anatina]
MPFDYPLVTGTEHWRRKMRTVFRGLDSNGDGLVTKEDYVKSAQRAAQYLNLNEKQARAQLDLRLAISRIVNAKDDEDGMEPVVTEEEYINRRIETFNDRHFRQEMYPVIISAEFSTMDTNGDGLISHEEFAAYCCSFNIPTGYSKKMFDVLDVNNDGVISIEEFGQGHVDFWLGEDPNSKYNEFIGPLVD